MNRFHCKTQRPGVRRVVALGLAALLSASMMSASASPVLFSEPSPPDSPQVSHTAAYLGIGQAVADFDRDGWPDVYLTSGQGPNTLLRNDHGGLVPAADAGVLELPAHTSAGALFFDYDNDGWSDLLVLGQGGSYLFRNQEGAGWVDVTTASSLGTSGRGQSAAVADFNRDGWLDLYVVHWYFGEDEDSPLRADQLFVNQQGQFEDASQWLDEDALSGPGFAAVWLDYNNDGLSDLYVVNDKLYGNILWRNDGPGCGGWCFSDVSVQTGATRPAFSMGIAAGDPDLDGDLDLYYSSIGEQVLLENQTAQGQDAFVEISSAAGVSPDAIGWGAMFLDADNDARPDLYLATSNADPARCNRFWRNLGDGVYEDLSGPAGLGDCGFSMGLARADFDRDGRIDLILGNWGERFVVYRNQSPAGRSLRVFLDGAEWVNRDAVGTRGWLRDSEGRVQMQELALGSGHGGNHEAVLHFGLGSADATELELRWPDGVIQRLVPPAVGGELRLAHPHSGAVFIDGFEAP